MKRPVFISLALLAALAASPFLFRDQSPSVQPEPFFGSGEGWYDELWLYRVAVTVQNGEVDADLTDFPVYVDLNDLPAGFHTNVTADGGDIRVTSSDGTTEVPRELVYYDATGDTGELHFKGTLSNTLDTVFYIYYGNAAANDYAIDDTYGAENVWNSAYKAVFHFSEEPDNSSGQIKDSTTNDNDGTSVLMETTDRVAGTVGHGFDFDNAAEYINLGDVLDMGTNDQTIDVVFTSSTDNVQSIVSKSSFRSNFGRWFLYSEVDGKPIVGLQTVGTDTVATASSVAVGTGVNVLTARWDRNGNATLRRNKSETLSVSISAGDGENMQNSDELYIGAYADEDGVGAKSPYWFDGIMSEVRISQTLRTVEWADATYDNLITPDTFYVAGTEEEVPESNPTSDDTAVIRTAAQEVRTADIIIR